MVLDVLRQHCLIWNVLLCMMLALGHDDVIRWKHFPRYWPFVKGIHRPPVDSFHKGHWRGTLMFSLICAWTNGLANNRDDGQLRSRHAHYDITVMICAPTQTNQLQTQWIRCWNLFKPCYQFLYEVTVCYKHGYRGHYAKTASAL